jgi:hypothetical protein
VVPQHQLDLNVVNDDLTIRQNTADLWGLFSSEILSIPLYSVPGHAQKGMYREPNYTPMIRRLEQQS